MTAEAEATTRGRDASGFRVFSDGEEGRAHVMAHRMLDGGSPELGHRLLGRWLQGREGSGSSWTHLQWHMAVFEIAVGCWDGAWERFNAEILPVAATSDQALTDAPALLWRLALSAPRGVSFDWEPVRRTASRNLGINPDPYVRLHCLLALAGAGDLEALDGWLTEKRGGRSLEGELLVRFGVGLRAVAAGDDVLAASALAAVVPRVWELGGSSAQNELFAEIADASRQRASILRAVA